MLRALAGVLVLLLGLLLASCGPPARAACRPRAAACGGSKPAGNITSAGINADTLSPRQALRLAERIGVGLFASETEHTGREAVLTRLLVQASAAREQAEARAGRLLQENHALEAYLRRLEAKGPDRAGGRP